MSDTEVRRQWVDKAHTRIRCYQFVQGRHTIPDIIRDLESRGVDWRTASLNYSATWEDNPTPEELAEQMTRDAKAAERQESWEREALVRLTEKYGPVS